MRFIDVENFAIRAANLAFADLEEKKQIRDSIMEQITIACLHYESNSKFKEEVRDYANQLKNERGLQ